MYARAVVAGGLLVIMAHLIADEPEPTRFAGAAVLLLAIGVLLGVDLLSTIGRGPRPPTTGQDGPQPPEED